MCNNMQGTNYEHFCSLVCNKFSGDRKRGAWVHCNFSAKQNADGKSSCKNFFAEILLDRNYRSMKETLTITACLMLEGIATAGCNFCSNVFHPANGFLKGPKSQNKPRCSYSPSSSFFPLSPTSPSSPISKKENPDSSVDMQSFEVEVSAELRRQANIALEHFNKGNGTDYKLVEVLDGNSIDWEGYWFHFNFKANSPKDDIDGESSSKLFFAENFAVIDKTVTWTAIACHLLDGKTTDGCIFCRGIIHPTHGFSQGITRAQIASSPFRNTVPCDLEAENHDRRAEAALEYFNKEHGTNYELVLVMVHNKILPNGYHYNFEAKQEVDGKYTWRIFFAEVLSTASVCLILEGETTAGCRLCSDVIHPASWEFPKGNHESPSPDFATYLPNSPTCSRTENIDSSVDMRSVEVEVSAELSRQANIALEHFNKENGTDYKLVEVLDGNSIYCEEGYWFHFNFKANSPKGDIDVESSSKLFFAENFAVIAETVTWTANACHLLDGKTTDGCTFCRGIIHPTHHGFSQGITRAQINRCSAQINTVVPRDLPRDLPSTEKRCRRAEMAIEFYNDNNGSDYELVDLFLSNGFLSDGAWYHFNFEAKQDVDGKYNSRIFFAELFADNSHPTTETLTVTACQILDGETTGSCGFCSNVIHPCQGDFLKVIT